MAQPPINFDDVMADIGKIQQVLARMHGTLKQPQQKQIIGELMEKIEKSKAETETEFPKAMKTIRDSATNTQAEAKALREQLRQQQAELDAKAAEHAKKPALPKLPTRKPKIEPAPEPSIEGGGLLRKELLERFAGHSKSTSPESDREIWEDWEWE